MLHEKKISIKQCTASVKALANNPERQCEKDGKQMGTFLLRGSIVANHADLLKKKKTKANG
jgi:hypothetical protein